MTACILRWALVSCLSLSLLSSYTSAAQSDDYIFESLIAATTDNLIGGISVATDSLNRPHILFTLSPRSENTQTLMYGTRQAGTWSFEPVTTGTVKVGSHGLVLDESDHPHIATLNFETQDVMYGTRNSGGWDIETVASDGHYHAPAIELGQSGAPHLAYMYSSNATTGRPILTMRSNSGDWITTPSLIPETLVGSNAMLDLLIDETGNPYMTYTGLSGWGQPWYVAMASMNAGLGTLTSEIILQDEERGSYVAGHLAQDGSGELRVFVVEYATGKISHHTRANGLWVEDFWRYDRRDFNGPGALVIDENDNSLLLTARNNNNVGSGALDLWTLGADGPTREIIAYGSYSDGESVGLTHGMTLDSDGNPHIFYTQQLNRGLVYAYVPEPDSIWLMTLLLLLCIRRCRITLACFGDNASASR